MNYDISQIALLIKAHRIGSANAVIKHLLTDSRSLIFPETTLFFAIRTRLGDGHRYIDELYRRGVRNFVISELPPTVNGKSAVLGRRYADANFLVVGSPLCALQNLAEQHRACFQIPVIGITGSNGKTVVKEWLNQILSPALNVTRSPRSYNSQIGVPLSIWLMNEQSEIGIFEAGISERGEMQNLQKIIRPTIGILTNIGEAHSENFASLEEKCKEKLELFKDADLLIYNADDEIINHCIHETDFKGKCLPWSKSKAECPLSFTPKLGENSTGIAYTYNGVKGEFEIPFTDNASLQNAISVLAASLYLGLSPEIIAQRMKGLEPIAMRLEVKQGLRGCTIINDSYNSDLTSLDIALDHVRRRPTKSKSSKRTLILSDIQQSGLSNEQLYRHVADMATACGFSRIIGVGENISKAKECFGIEKHFFPTSLALLNSCLLEELHDEVILLKGARKFCFEQLADRLTLRMHETTLEVNLDALTDNLNFYRSFLKPNVRMVCMVKASAYGAGAIEVSKTLQDRGVDYLAVAVADEGAELRSAGITTGIMVMNPELSAFNTLFEHCLEPEVYSFHLLEALINAAERAGITNMPIHIKLDTGMHRLGFSPRHDIPALIKRLKSQKALTPLSVFSHFAGSDSEDFNAFSTLQFKLFQEAADQLQAAFPHKILRHICNSAGIERFPERHLDMVRLGLGLYGIDPIDNRRLHTVMSLRTTILQIRNVPEDETVGYSRRGTLARPSRIAAIPIGYADGLRRQLGCGKGYCMVNGRPAPYVGNICMDVCMIDVTDIPCAEGDSVEIFGDNLPVTKLSDRLQTIPYEVFTSISPRVKRVYFRS